MYHQNVTKTLQKFSQVLSEMQNKFHCILKVESFQVQQNEQAETES